MVSESRRAAGQRPYSIRTRIKTLTEQLMRLTTMRQRPYSIRTRIKTHLIWRVEYEQVCQRPYSIRTRIKTRTIKISTVAFLVRDHIPLEQGLRR